MTNITARKGLAFGALIALGSTLLAGAPAHAAAGVTLAPSLGTSLTVPSGYGFALTATASSEIPTDRLGEFKFKIVNVDGANAYAETYKSFNKDTGWGNYFDGKSVDGAAGDSFTIDAYTTPGQGVNPKDGVNNNVVVLWSGEDSTVTSHFNVTTWLDANDDNVVDAGEYSATKTVTFLKASAITATTKVVAPLYSDDQSVDATTELTNINVDQYRNYYINNAYPAVALKVNTSATGGSPVNASWDADNNDWDVSDTVNALVKGDVVSAQAKVEFSDGWVNVGAANTATVVASVSNYIDASLVKSTTSDGSSQVALNKEFQVKATVYDADDNALAGKTVNVTFDGDNFDLVEGTSTITVNGTVYKTNDALEAGKLALVTDSKGQVTITVSSTGLSNNDVIHLHYVTEGRVNNSDITYDTYATEKALSYTAWIENNHQGEFGAVAGATTSGTVVVYDQFGGVIPAGYVAQVQYYYDGDNRSDTNATDATNSYQTVVNGKASFKVVDDGKGTGPSYYVVNIVKVDATNGGYVLDNSGFPVVYATTYFDINYVDAIDLVPGSIVAADEWAALDDNKVYQYTTAWDRQGASSEKAPVATFDFGAFDSRAILGTEPDYSWGSVVGFEGYVKSATTSDHEGIAIPGATVTFAGAGLQFLVGNNGFGVFSTDTAATTAYEDGYFSVNIWSHKSGLNSFTITSGGVTQKVEFYVAAPSSDAGANVTVTAPAFSLPAKNIVGNVLVTDKFGNAVPNAPVELKLTGLSNPIYWNYSNTNGTNDEGISYLDINPGVNDLGTITWTAILNKDGDWDALGDDDIVKTATTVVALGAVVPADAKVAVSSAATSQAGRAVDVTVTVTTAAGVAIPGAIVNLAATGAGYLGATTATTDANGKATVKLIGGDSEIGDAVVTATAGSVSASAKTAFGVTDANINLAGKRVTVDWSFAAGKRVVIYRNGIQIRNFVAGSDASDSFSFNLKKGTRKIAVKIGGVTIDVQVYHIK